MSFKSNVDNVPPAIAALGLKVAEFTDSPQDWVFVADHTHEEVSEGSWTIALEGDYEWPHLFINNVPAPQGWAFDVYTGWCLLVYPTR